MVGEAQRGSSPRKGEREGATLSAEGFWCAVRRNPSAGGVALPQEPERGTRRTRRALRRSPELARLHRRGRQARVHAPLRRPLRSAKGGPELASESECQGAVVEAQHRAAMGGLTKAVEGHFHRPSEQMLAARLQRWRPEEQHTPSTRIGALWLSYITSWSIGGLAIAVVRYGLLPLALSLPARGWADSR